MPLLSEAPALFVGDTPVQRVYLGDTLVWEPPSAGWGPDEFIFASETTPAGTSPQSFPFTFGIRFTPVVDGRITGVRFYSYTAVTGRQVSIWSDTGAKLAHGVGGVEVGVGWQVIPLDEPLSVKAGVPLVTSYGWHNSWGQFGYTVEQTPVSASPNLIAGKGSYHQGDMDSFPEADGGQHYYADVVFQAGSDGLDPDTRKFLDATGLPEYFAPALDGLVKGLKGTGLWSKMTAVYPFIGGTADFHKWNLIDPRDTDDAHRLTYVEGTGSHSTELGYKPNATHNSGGGYADTHLIPAGLIDPASAHLSAYSLSALANGQRCDFGAYNWDGTTNRFHLIVHYMSGEFYYSLGHTGMNNTPAGDGSGLFTSSRTSMSEETAYLNGAAIASNQTAGGVLPPVPLYIGCLNGFANEYSDLPFGFVSIGSGLDAQNVADLNTVVQEYRLAVSNAHWTPKSIPGLVAWIDPTQDTFGDGQKIIEYREHANGEVFTTDGVNGPIFHGGGAPYIEWPATHVGFTSAQQRTFHDGATVISVCSVEGGSYPMMAVIGTDPNGLEMRHDGVSQQLVVMYTSYGIVFSHPTPLARQKALYAMRVEPGAATAAWTNDVQALGGAPASMLPEPQTIYIGRRQGGYYFVGPMYETLVYDGPVSDADLALLTEYLGAKHGLTRRYW